uniref:Ig-like domain-containing protein n=1 Tax=Labrus bergylta TaxID=56723 RepID=A0A3Q3G6I6_9LABR
PRFCSTVFYHSAEQECPIEITPDRMVIEYQGRNQNATCKAISNMQGNVKEIYWQGNKSSSWSADTHKDWDPKPVCNANFEGIGWCKKRLNFTLYKIPDSVSILIVGNLSSVVEAREFQLQCDITNVAPAGNLAVRWYIGNETIEPLKGRSITLNRTHNGAELRCEAQLDLGFEEPQPPPNMKSSPLNISVHLFKKSHSDSGLSLAFWKCIPPNVTLCFATCCINIGLRCTLLYLLLDFTCFHWMDRRGGAKTKNQALNCQEKLATVLTLFVSTRGICCCFDVFF